MMWERLHARDKFLKKCRSEGVPGAERAWKRIEAHRAGECGGNQKWLDQQVKEIWVRENRARELGGEERKMMEAWLTGNDVKENEKRNM